MAFLVALLPFLLLGFVGADVQEAYSSNFICRQNNCINPVFPGLLDMPKLEQLVWECSSEGDVKKYLDFCKGVIHYDTALPSPQKKGQGIDSLVHAQDEAALTMFFYHMNALGYEAWDYTSPWNSSSPCVQSVWRLTCFTYFPKSQAGCRSGESTQYYRPCRDCCENYLDACSVQCCDESALCNFEHATGETNSTGGILIQTGYASDSGPSATCTGKAPSSAASRNRSPLMLLLLLLGFHVATSTSVSPRKSSAIGSMSLTVLLAVFALALQGIDVQLGNDLNIPHHSAANWRSKPNYLVGFEFIPPGQNASSAVLNSCATSTAIPCSGHGTCKNWRRQYAGGDPAAIAFCQCDPEWADPECRTLRKSQLYAFLFALFGGWIGADYFYLGFPIWGIVKALTLGGFGVLWLVDIVRTGAGPVYASNFRVSPDLPHFLFVTLTVVLFLIIGFVLSINSYFSLRNRKRSEFQAIHQREEGRTLGKLDEMDGPRFSLSNQQAGYEGSRAFSGYGATLPMPLQNAGAPRASTSSAAFGA